MFQPNLTNVPLSLVLTVNRSRTLCLNPAPHLQDWGLGVVFLHLWFYLNAAGVLHGVVLSQVTEIHAWE